MHLMDEREEHNARTGSRWRRMARRQLKMFPLCEQCKREGRVTAAEVAHHVDGVHHDKTRLYLGRLESSCKHCHDSYHKRVECSGSAFDRTIGFDGWPISKDHPANQMR
jgi:hypothetical protein